MAGVKALCVAALVLVVLLDTALAAPGPFSFWSEKKEDNAG